MPGPIDNNGVGGVGNHDNMSLGVPEHRGSSGPQSSSHNSSHFGGLNGGSPMHNLGQESGFTPRMMANLGAASNSGMHTMMAAQGMMGHNQAMGMMFQANAAKQSIQTAMFTAVLQQQKDLAGDVKKMSEKIQ